MHKEVLTPDLSSSARVAERLIDVAHLRSDFPTLGTMVRGKPLVYLDNAASTQKPKIVMDTINEFYSEHYSNVHRGVHYLSQKATDLYEEARRKIKRFINAAKEEEIIFVRGTTEGINLVAQTWGRDNIGRDDEIIVSEIEHHANIVPWQMLCQATGAKLRVIPMNERGELEMDEYRKLLNDRSKIVAVTHVSNALGTITPIRQIIDLAHEHGIPVLVDGAQSIQHMAIDVQAMDADFFVFSGHKIYGPTGIGVLYGKADLLRGMSPYQGGGDMILSVTFEKTTYNDIPYKFEAGTPNIAGAIGLGAALDYFSKLDSALVESHENDLLNYATAKLSEMSELKLIGTAAEKASVISFTLCAVHPHDIGTILDQNGIAIRAGHHCAQPVMQYYGIPATARVSFSFYNSREDVNRLVTAIHDVLEVFS